MNILVYCLMLRFEFWDRFYFLKQDIYLFYVVFLNFEFGQWLVLVMVDFWFQLFFCIVIYEVYFFVLFMNIFWSFGIDLMIILLGFCWIDFLFGFLLKYFYIGVFEFLKFVYGVGFV